MTDPRGWILAAATLAMMGFARAQELRQPVPPDARCDVDVLLVVAHPDDETAIGAQLAQLVVDGQRSLAVVYCTRGSGGGNNAGVEQGASMGALREIEARRALATLGISLVWFIDGRDTPGQDVFASLDAWGHGESLEQLVRLIRLTRPEVILTWLPAVVPGENHGDHQAAGVITTEAFDLAGDPTAFPVQVTPPREPTDIDNIGEGLHPWQPQKLYYFSDATRAISGEGPAFDISAHSRRQGVPLIELAARIMELHTTQGEVSEPAVQALATGDYSGLLSWLGRFRLLFGKSVVPCERTGEVFEGVRIGPTSFAPAPGYLHRQAEIVSISLGGPFRFYRWFWTAHGIDHIASWVEPALEVTAGSYVHIPLVVSNGTGDTVVVTLRPELPPDVVPVTGEERVLVPPRQEYSFQTFQWAPPNSGALVELRWTGWLERQKVGEVKIPIATVSWGLPW